MNRRRILGLNFCVGDCDSAARLAVTDGGLFIFPSAPVLLELCTNQEYARAARRADYVLTDSGLMVLIWKLLTGENLPRVSGLAFLRALLQSVEGRNASSQLWVMPSLQAARRCQRFLIGLGCCVTLENFYIASHYPEGPVHDQDLLAFVNERRPFQIFISIGGGTQERVGLFLREHLNYRASIHCIGAAIGFLTGDQVAIPAWADRCRLGWMFRCCSNPRRFVPRYVRSFGLVWLLWKHREEFPVAA